MQHINGSARQYGATIADSELESEIEQEAGTTYPPAMTFLNAQILTRVWANPNHWGDITWKVDQLRIKAPTASKKHARNLFASDLWDAMRGLYQAHRWIKKADRRRRRGGFWK